MDCEICCEKFNNTKLKKITCYLCNNSFCKKCCIHVLQESSNTEPFCLNCKVNWDYSFFVNVMTKKFINTDWKNLKKEKLFQKEKIRLPESQSLIIKHKKNVKEQTDAIDSLKKSLIETQDTHSMLLIVAFLRSAIFRLKDLEENCVEYILENKGKKIKLSYKMNCQKCNGVVENDWSCGLCETKYCSKCGEEKEKGHVCNEDNVQTMILLKKDTKPCPKCNVSIHKIDGCSQIWCTECHTAFDWKTGKIETGIVHNPHFFEWQRQNNIEIPRNPNDNECIDEDIVLLNFSRIVKSKELVKINGFRLDIVAQLIMFDTEEKDNTKLRVLYLLGRLTEYKFKELLIKKDKQISFSEKIAEVTRTLNTLLISICIDIQNNSESEENGLERIEKLRIYINECFSKVISDFNSKRKLMIDENWRNISLKL